MLVRQRITLRLPRVVLQIVDEIASEAGTRRSQVVCYALHKLLGPSLAPEKLLHSSYGSNKGSWRDLDAAVLRVKREIYT